MIDLGSPCYQYKVLAQLLTLLISLEDAVLR